MSRNFTELLASIPMRDESIRLALAEIEQKLAAWSAAVGNYAPAPRDGHASQASTPASSAASLTDTSETKTNAPAATQDDAAERVEEQSHVDVAESVTEQSHENAADEGPSQASSVEGDDSAYQVTDDDQQETPVSRPANPDDDESVLVGLSPESAKAIKVQWRLLEGTKSLRQLVEEHKARLVRGDGSRDGKRSWWTRGKG